MAADVPNGGISTEKYSRQTLFAPLGKEGQLRLMSSRAVIIGCGALGSFHASALARAGVGELVLIDRDYVEESNLQRQWLYDESDARDGLPKAIAAERKLRAVNSEISVTGIVTDVDATNVERLIKDADVILDGSDNFAVRYLINEAAVKNSIPWIYGAAVGSYGVTATILPGRTPCLACLLPDAPGGAQPTCDTAGILNVAASAVASFQVANALKILSGQSEAVEPRLLTLDVWQGSPRSVAVGDPDPGCRVCADREFKLLDAAGTRPGTILCGRNAIQVRGDSPIDIEMLATRLGALGEVRANEYALRFVTPPYEMTIFVDGRAIIKGTDDPAKARSLYSRFLGR
jgi:molybdopterin/thiamine biosynthesis adenylyltransferase